MSACTYTEKAWHRLACTPAREVLEVPPFLLAIVISTPDRDSFEKYRDTPLICTMIVLNKYALPPICITMLLPFVSRAFAQVSWSGVVAILPLLLKGRRDHPHYNFPAHLGEPPPASRRYGLRHLEEREHTHTHTHTHTHSTPENGGEKGGGKTSRGDPPPQKQFPLPLSSVHLAKSLRDSQDFPKATPLKNSFRRVSKTGFQGAILAR